MGSISGTQPTDRQIGHVHHCIELCIKQYMNKKETIDHMAYQMNVAPAFTRTVWEKLEQDNPDFFWAYYTRLVLKDQITKFNALLSVQAELMYPHGNPENIAGVNDGGSDVSTLTSENNSGQSTRDDGSSCQGRPQVHDFIMENCIKRYVNKMESIKFLATRHDIDPDFVQQVWEKLEKDNEELFSSYYKRSLNDHKTTFSSFDSVPDYLMYPQGDIVGPSYGGSNVSTLRTFGNNSEQRRGDDRSSSQFSIHNGISPSMVLDNQGVNEQIVGTVGGYTGGSSSDSNCPSPSPSSTPESKSMNVQNVRTGRGYAYGSSSNFNPPFNTLQLNPMNMHTFRTGRSYAYGSPSNYNPTINIMESKPLMGDKVKVEPSHNEQIVRTSEDFSGGSNPLMDDDAESHSDNRNDTRKKLN